MLALIEVSKGKSNVEEMRQWPGPRPLMRGCSARTPAPFSSSSGVAQLTRPCSHMSGPARRAHQYGTRSALVPTGFSHAHLRPSAATRERAVATLLLSGVRFNSVGPRKGGNGSGRGRRFASHHAEACVRHWVEVLVEIKRRCPNRRAESLAP